MFPPRCFYLILITTTLIFCRKQVQASHADAEKDAVVVPTTMEEYCMKAKPLRPAQDSIEMDDFYDDDCYDMDDEDEEDDDFAQFQIDSRNLHF